MGASTHTTLRFGLFTTLRLAAAAAPCRVPPRVPSPAHAYLFQRSLCTPAAASAPRRTGRFSPRACAADAVLSGELDIFGRPIRTAKRVGQTDGEEAVLDGAPTAEEASGNSEPVVKIFAVHSAVNPQLPWTSKTQEESTGSGFSIERDGEYVIMTNAHVVADATYIEVRKAGDARKYVATRRKVSHECDLATLTVEDSAFWKDAAPLSFGAVPCLQDEVSVVGYPEGGEGVSVTVGVVSRIEIQRYAHSGANLLAIQIDAAINPGNSGGPALDEAGRVIGVAFQNQQDSQNIGYVIPVPTIEHFLADVDPRASSATAGEKCAGFCSLGIFWQALENEQLRAYYRVDSSRSGVLVRGLSPLSAARGLLQRDDVLLELDGKPIANDGTFAVGAQERLSFQHLIHLKFPGDEVDVRVLRGDREMALRVPVQPLRRLVPAVVYDEPQPYFLYGGFAFVGLTEPYLHEWGDEWIADAPQDLVHLALTGVQQQPDEQPVILSRCFPSRRTAGYAHMADRQVVRVNGQPVVNLQQMYSLVRNLHETSEFLAFEVYCTGGNAIVTSATDVAEATLDETMQLYRIPAAASAELVEAHEAGVGAAGGDAPPVDAAFNDLGDGGLMPSQSSTASAAGRARASGGAASSPAGGVQAA